ncbi:MAG TPA: hypothetical protein VGD21_11995 [Lysobacter sp.]
MNINIARSVLPVALLACMATIGQAEAADVQYRVKHLGPVDGTPNRGNSVNNLGWVSGYSSKDGIGPQHRRATLWAYGHKLDLGTLGGPNSNVAWPVKNNIGRIVGISQTDTPDPLGENWSCSAFFTKDATGKTCLGFVWEFGTMRALPTLGGNNGFASGANNFGLISGWAETAVHDTTCVAPQVLQFRAVVWGPKRDQIRELPPLKGDSSGAATAINDKGQVVGISGDCDVAVGRFTAKHAVLWDKGRPIDLGNLGAEMWVTPMAITQRGDVIVGFAALPETTDPDSPVLRAFIWTKATGMQRLAELPGDTSSQANGVNAFGHAVGTSCGAGGCRAVLWKDGVVHDLNDLVEPDYAGHLEQGQDINDFGKITGRAVDPSIGKRPAFEAVPIL